MWPLLPACSGNLFSPVLLGSVYVPHLVNNRCLKKPTPHRPQAKSTVSRRWSCLCDSVYSHALSSRVESSLDICSRRRTGCVPLSTGSLSFAAKHVTVVARWRTSNPAIYCRPTNPKRIHIARVELNTNQLNSSKLTWTELLDSKVRTTSFATVIYTFREKMETIWQMNNKLTGGEGISGGLPTGFASHLHRESKNKTLNSCP